MPKSVSAPAVQVSRRNFTFFLVILGLLLAAMFITYSFGYNSGTAAVLNSSSVLSEAQREKAVRLAALAPVDLVSIFNSLKEANTVKECHAFDNCFKDTFPSEVKAEIAIRYGVVKTGNDGGDIYIGLVPGAAVDVSGQGIADSETKSKLRLKDAGWYWEIGSCSTNNRVFVDTTTGEAGPLHSFMYCVNAPSPTK